MRDVSYQLVIEIGEPLICRVGRLGVFEFPRGRYVYTGSAKRGLDSRIARHHRAEKKLQWHIDYLLAARGVGIVRVVRSSCGECALNRAVDGDILVRGFGASDCTAGCGAHLKWVAPLRTA